MANDEEDFSEFTINHSGYQRFFNDIANLDDCNNTILTVRREQKITAQFIPQDTMSKIKVSLSQEQIVNRLNSIRPVITRSQSINIERSCALPKNGHRKLVKRQSLLKPSLIPVKMDGGDTHFANKQQLELTLPHQPGSMIPRKIITPPNVTDDKRKFTSQQELKVITPPLPMTYSMDTAFEARRISDVWNKLPERFKCGVCLNVLNDPRVLDCLHTFCLDCLYGIENTNQSKSVSHKANAPANNENNDIDGCCSNATNNDTKESGRRSSKASTIVATTNPIRKIFFSMPKKRADERKDSSPLQPKRKLSTVTEKSRASLKCPVCSCKTEISTGGITRVPRNFLLERQLQDELRKLEAQRISNESCSLCYDNIQAVGHCTNCQLNLCEICFEAHLRQRSTAKHALISLDDMRRKQMELLKEQSVCVARTTLKCFMHPMQDLKFYCVVCDQIACHNCTILLHKGHKFESVARATKRAIKEFKDAFERNQKFHEYVNDSISKLSGSLPKIDVKADAVQKEIEQFLKDYFEALEAHKETLLRQIAKAKETKHLSIVEQQDYLRKRAHESKVINHFADNLLKSGSDTEILVFVGILQRRFEHCQKSKMSIDPKIPDAFQFLREIRAPATQQQHNIPMFGIIATQVADPKYSTIDSVEPIILRINRRTELKMVARDCDDRPLCHGGLGAKLRVELGFKDDPVKRISTEVSDKRDGSYVIAFTPDTPGTMTLTIKIDNQNINGSPFLLCIRTLRPHSGIYHCCTFCSSRSSRTATCACDGKMLGYKGCGHGHDRHPGKRHWSCCASVLESSECSATNSFPI